MKRLKLSVGRVWVVLTAPAVLLGSLFIYFAVHIGFFIFVWVPVWASGATPKTPDWFFADEPGDWSVEVTARYARFFIGKGASR